MMAWSLGGKIVGDLGAQETGPREGGRQAGRDVSVWSPVLYRRLQQANFLPKSFKKLPGLLGHKKPFAQPKLQVWATMIPLSPLSVLWLSRPVFPPAATCTSLSCPCDHFHPLRQSLCRGILL